MSNLIEASLWSEAKKLIDAASAPLVLAHRRPDVDAISSLSVMGSLLAQLGKKGWLAVEGGVPQHLQFIPGTENISAELPAFYDLIICLDTSDTTNLGILGNLALTDGRPVLVVDHHSSNTYYGACNVVSERAISTTDLLYEALLQWLIPIHTRIAECILSGMLMDTQIFRFGIIDQRVLTQTIDLINHGADFAAIRVQVEEESPLNRLQLLGRALSRAQFNNGIIWTWLEVDDFNEYGVPANNTIDAAPVLVQEKDVKIAAEFAATQAGNVRLSIHARPGYDVSLIAVRYGGGGHARAAGCTLTDDTALSAAQRFLPELRDIIDN